MNTRSQATAIMGFLFLMTISALCMAADGASHDERAPFLHTDGNYYSIPTSSSSSVRGSEQLAPEQHSHMQYHAVPQSLTPAQQFGAVFSSLIHDLRDAAQAASIESRFNSLEEGRDRHSERLDGFERRMFGGEQRHGKLREDHEQLRDEATKAFIKAAERLDALEACMASMENERAATRQKNERNDHSLHRLQRNLASLRHTPGDDQKSNWREKASTSTPVETSASTNDKKVTRQKKKQ